MKKQILAGIAAVATAATMLSAPVAAEVPVTLNLGAAKWVFDGDRQLDDTWTPWVSLEYAFSDNWAAEVLYADEDTRFRDGSNVDITTWQVGMLYYAGSYTGGANQVRPYGTFGMGEIDVDGGGYDRETAAHAGAGVRWMMTPRFGARLEARMLHSLDENENDLLFSAGVNYYFGQVEAAAAPAPAPSAPVDSDGDGVPDDRDQCPGTPPNTRVDANGCPLPVARVASIKLKVNFDFDSSVVKDQYFSDIRELAEFLKRFDDLQVEVEGHTDNVGPESYNQKLSQSRAKAVVDVLVNQHGIASQRLKPQGYGESRPVASNDNKAGRADNRRVMATLEVEYEE